MEFLGSGGGHGTASLAFIAARNAIHEGGVIAISDPGGTFYPPAACGWDIPANDLVARK